MTGKTVRAARLARPRQLAAVVLPARVRFAPPCPKQPYSMGTIAPVMWCSNCGQQVPGIGLDPHGPVCCVRCGMPVRAPSAVAGEQNHQALPADGNNHDEHHAPRGQVQSSDNQSGAAPSGAAQSGAANTAGLSSDADDPLATWDDLADTIDEPFASAAGADPQPAETHESQQPAAESFDAHPSAWESDDQSDESQSAAEQADTASDETWSSDVAWHPNDLFEQWDELAARIDRTRHLLGTLSKSADPQTAASLRSEASELLRQAARTARPVAKKSTAPRRSWFAWPATGLGIMGLVCGVVLIGWSMAGSRPELWSVGLPMALVSQALLILGLLGHLERLQAGYRQTSDRLQHLDEQLDEVRHVAMRESPVWASASRAFYCHLADGAAPQTLLADLKSQLDLLAVRINQQSR